MSSGKKLMCTARPSWKSISFQPMSYKSRMHKIEINLPNIISIDDAKRSVRVEPMVSIGELNDYLIKRGWMLPVVPELDELTIGGLVMGGGIETTSHKHGLFHATCQAYELVLADGSVVWCDKDRHQKLFCSIPFSYGTLGFLAAVDINIVPFKPYLKQTYIPVSSIDEAVKVFETETNDESVNTVEGIMYSKDDGVIMSGKFEADIKDKSCSVNHIGRWYQIYYFRHVQKFLEDRKIVSEYIPTLDYYHRHNKGLFWMANYLEHSTQNPIFRYILGWTRPSKFSLLKWVRNSLFREFWDPVLQDYMVRLEDLKDFLENTHELFKIYPIWLCPVRHTLEIVPEEIRPLVRDALPNTTIVDVGIYGHPLAENYNKESCQKKTEQWCLERGGFVALYAETLLTKEEFVKMFHPSMQYYDEMRKEYGGESAFPHVYEKISSNARG